MARYRKKQSNRYVALEDGIRLLREEVQQLELQRWLIDAGIPTENALWNVAAEYFRLFRNGYKPPVFVSKKAAVSTKTQQSSGYYVQRDFLQGAMSPNVVCGAVWGVEALLEHWRVLSFYFPDIDMEIVRLEKQDQDTLLATTKMKVTITEHTLRHAFPHLVGSPALAAKLLEQHLTVRGSVRFEWDVSVIGLHHSGDLLAPMLKLLGRLEDVSRVFEKARISADCRLQ